MSQSGNVIQSFNSSKYKGERPEITNTRGTRNDHNLKEKRGVKNDKN